MQCPEDLVWRPLYQRGRSKVRFSWWNDASVVRKVWCFEQFRTQLSVVTTSQCRGVQGSQAVSVLLQVLLAGGEGATEAGGESSNVCGYVWKHPWSGLVVVGDLMQNIQTCRLVTEMLHLSHTSKTHTSIRTMKWAGMNYAGVCGPLFGLNKEPPFAHLGDCTGLRPDSETSTKHLSPGIVLSGRVGGPGDRAQGNLVRVPERDTMIIK